MKQQQHDINFEEDSEKNPSSRWEFQKITGHLFQRRSSATGYGEISLTGVFINGVRLTTSQVKCMFNQVYSLTEILSDVGMLNLLTGWLVE